MSLFAFSTSLCFIVYIACGVAFAQSPSNALVGKIVGVTDGDTVTLLVERSQYRVRLTEIDTPESGQPWGTRAKQALSDKVFNKMVIVRTEGVDKYGRQLGRIYVDGRDINREMVREGNAWVYRKYMKDSTFLEDEAYAQKNALGLWALPESERMPPWEWRHGGRQTRQSPASDNGNGSAEMDGAAGCGTKQYCTQMSSCDEAMYYFQNCGLNRLDGDADGVPCEAMCR